jgi:glutathione S-transferase
MASPNEQIPELISFKTCPFVQRSVITMILQKRPFKLTNIDLRNKPDWFLKISPLGKVPVMKVNEDVLFESAVINEYLDETASEDNRLSPKDPLAKARNRAWLEYFTQLFTSWIKVLNSKTKEDHETEYKEFSRKLKYFEDYKPTVLKGQYLNGDKVHYFVSDLQPNLIDIAIAPFAQRMLIWDQHSSKPLIAKADFPHVHAWFNNLFNFPELWQAQKQLLELPEETSQEDVQKTFWAESTKAIAEGGWLRGYYTSEFIKL